MTGAELAAAFDTLPRAWRACLPCWAAQARDALVASVVAASGSRPIAPADPFRALRLVAPEEVRVVVFGQDPYPGEGHADGLAFSAPTASRPSLRRIFDVLEADRPGWRRPRSGRLDAWARQGVLLLNPTLTVEVGRKNSHTAVGWQAFTGEIVRALALRTPPPTFLAWGAQAIAFLRDNLPADAKVPVLTTRHPANDFERSFMADGSHFARTADLVNWWVLADEVPAGSLQPENSWHN
ncbi:MAG: uracil-DNA glycosylase [Tibeticola sp.]